MEVAATCMACMEAAATCTACMEAAAMDGRATSARALEPALESTLEEEDVTAAGTVSLTMVPTPWSTPRGAMGEQEA